MTPLTSARTLSSRLSVVLIILLVAVGVTTGCGSSGTSSTGGGQKFSGNTNVTLVLSSTANDQLSQFNLDIQSLTLTSQSGSTAPVLAGDWQAEYMHLNGGIEPVATITLPQGIYVGATAVIGGADFTCLTVMPPGSNSPGNLDESTYAYGYTPSSNVTVTLPSPITITGDSMGLSLNLLVAQSASYPSSCYPSGLSQFAITPTFNLTPWTVTAQPTSPANGKITEFEGQVSALGTTGSGLSLSLSDSRGLPRTVSVSSDSNTVYQGLSNFSALQVGTLVDMDGAVQPDGSLLATRIAVYDPAALNVMIGPLLQLPISVPDFYSFPTEQQGQTYSVLGQSLGVYSYSGSTLFQISGQMSNVASLPFVASFNASNLVPGQNVAIFSQQITDYYGGDHTPATTMTLMPQTINGTILASSKSGNFSDYTVSLASYNLFPTLAVQPGQASLLNNPNVVEVYVDSNTQLLNTQALAPGSTLRFNGLVFNDNGTLRMDCGQVNDGVRSSSQSNAAKQLVTADTQTARREGTGQTLSVITTVTRSR